MGFLHETIVAIGVALMVVLSCSVSYLAREYAHTGHVPLAILDAIHTAHGSSEMHCVPHLRGMRVRIRG